MSKSFSRSVAVGLVSRAAANVARTIPTRPSACAIFVMPFSPRSKTGMITTSLITSQVSMRPAKSATSRRIRSSATSMTSSTGSSVSQSAVTECQHSG